MGQQRERALELTGGVVLGVLIADLLVRVLGNGPPQVGLMMVLAMSAAVLVGGGPMLMIEASVSAIIIGSSAPSSQGLFPTRPIEALVGGGVAFAVHSLVFPPDPVLHVVRSANAVFGALGRTLEDLAAALMTADGARAEAALEAARSIDGDVRALAEAVTIGRETARAAPLRWPARAALERHQEIARHLDFAVRNTRVLARDTVRYARSGAAPVPDLADAVADLGRAIWALAAAFDDPAARTLIEIAGQVRSTAADLARASQAATPDDRSGRGPHRGPAGRPPDTPRMTPAAPALNNRAARLHRRRAWAVTATPRRGHVELLRDDLHVHERLRRACAV